MLLTEAEASAESNHVMPRDTRMRETAGKMKQFATWFTHGVPGGAKLRASIYQAKTGAEVLEQVDAFFAGQMATVPDTEDESASIAPDAFDPALACD